ncbi:MULTISPECIES: helix-turn-helix domain-containing protein [Falsihalocynthiibacter]|uniref:helix-turn-helix domain-containing protein n=1 Tax=Falsihalocynthiibacter TaxID=2854182 RepID=UPI003002ACEC
MYVTFSMEQHPFSYTPFFKVPRKILTNAPNNRRYPSSANLFREGDKAEHVYEVKSGVLRLARVLANGRRQVIAFGLPGDIVGFPNGDFHHTDCDVVSSAEVIAHRLSELESAKGDLEIHRRLMKAALREISCMQDHVMMLACKSAMEKVASFLCVLSLRTGTPSSNYTVFSLPMCRADIADFLGLTIETVCRMFSLLRKEGTIALNTPQTVVVLDMEALTDASQSD